MSLALGSALQLSVSAEPKSLAATHESVALAVVSYIL